MALRRRVIGASDDGQPTKQVAERFGVSRAWVRRLKQRRRETDGDIAPRRRVAPANRKLDGPGEQRLRELLAEHPDQTLAEMRDHLRETLGLGVSRTTIGRTLARLGITLKKRR